MAYVNIKKEYLSQLVCDMQGVMLYLESADSKVKQANNNVKLQGEAAASFYKLSTEYGFKKTIYSDMLDLKNKVSHYSAEILEEDGSTSNGFSIIGNAIQNIGLGHGIALSLSSILASRKSEPRAAVLSVCGLWSPAVTVAKITIRIASWIDSLLNGNGSNNSQNNTESSPVNVNEGKYENLKSLQSYDSATKLKIQKKSKGGNDYSNYYVLDGFNPDYIYDQHDKWTDSKGKTYNGSSTCCQGVAIAIGKSLKNKDMVQPGVGVPDYTYPTTGKYCTQKLKGKPAQQKYNEIYKQLSAGNPVMITLNGYSKGADTHYVTCIGLSKEAVEKYGNNPDFSQVNIQPQDILVADPADGKIKKLSECKSQVRATGSIFVFDK